MSLLVFDTLTSLCGTTFPNSFARKSSFVGDDSTFPDGEMIGKVVLIGELAMFR